MHRLCGFFTVIFCCLVVAVTTYTAIADDADDQSTQSTLTHIYFMSGGEIEETWMRDCYSQDLLLVKSQLSWEVGKGDMEQEKTESYLLLDARYYAGKTVVLEFWDARGKAGLQEYQPVLITGSVILEVGDLYGLACQDKLACLGGFSSPPWFLKEVVRVLTVNATSCRVEFPKTVYADYFRISLGQVEAVPRQDNPNGDKIIALDCKLVHQ